MADKVAFSPFASSALPFLGFAFPDVSGSAPFAEVRVTEALLQAMSQREAELREAGMDALQASQQAAREFGFEEPLAA